MLDSFTFLATVSPSKQQMILWRPQDCSLTCLLRRKLLLTLEIARLTEGIYRKVCSNKSSSFICHSCLLTAGYPIKCCYNKKDKKVLYDSAVTTLRPLRGREGVNQSAINVSGDLQPSTLIIFIKESQS